MNDHYTIEDMQQYSSYQGGKCLSKEYWGIDKKLFWQCEKEHRWEAPFSEIRLGAWCKKCSIKEENLENIRAIVAKRGYDCLSSEYVSSKEKLQFRCSENHLWWSTPNNIKHGCGCRICSIKAQALARMDKIETFHEIAKAKGGKCLSTIYDAKNRKLEFQCSEGHNWQTDASNVKTGRWCPTCAYVIRGNKNRHPIEFYHKMAKDRGGKCLSTEFTNSRNKLEFECKEGHKWITSAKNVNRGSWCPLCGMKQTGMKLMDSLETYIDIAEKHGGKCLSTQYISSSTKLLFECAEKHQWYTTPSLVKQGAWCGICARKYQKVRKRQDSIETYQKVAEQHGGKCLSTEYITCFTKLLFQCAENHQWSTSSVSIKKGTWCPICNRKKRSEKMKGKPGRRNSIAVYQSIAIERGGKCLSNEHINYKTKLLFECAEKHQWYGNPPNIKKGSWCPVCAKNRKKKNKN